MKVEPMMDPGMYEVESRSEKDPHIIDMTAYKGNGFCTCNAFERTYCPNIKKGKGKTTCAHIDAVKEYEISKLKDRGMGAATQE